MVCGDCQEAGAALASGNKTEAIMLHSKCVGRAWLADLPLDAIERFGGSRCDCQHDVAFSVANRGSLTYPLVG